MGRARVAGWLLLAALAGCAGITPVADSPALLEGKVSLGGKGFAGAEVLLLHPDFHVLADGTPVARTLSAEDGNFRLSAPPGDYLLLARTPAHFSYFGRNPVHITNRLSGLHLPLAAAHPVTDGRAVPGQEGLGGRVLLGGQPVAGARVWAYLDLSKGMRGPGYAVSEPSSADGWYTLPLPAGTYFVTARLRKKGWRGGQLEPGDLLGVLSSFPLTLREGSAVRADIETVQVPDKDQMARYTGSFVTLSGRLASAGGVPVQGMHACLYDNPEMLDRPVAVSEPTGPDGRFKLETTRTGPYYLGARRNLGGPPTPGEQVGFYRGPAGTRLDLRGGAVLDDLVIVVQVVP